MLNKAFYAEICRKSFIHHKPVSFTFLSYKQRQRGAPKLEKGWQNSSKQRNLAG
jgi:hypothetical protein